MNYGLPYMGSKNKIAEWVVGHFPEKKHFYDLFAGGCAVTHCAMLKSKFNTYTINDISRMTEFFTDAIKRIDFIEKRSLLSGGSKIIHEEGLFVPKTQIEKGIFTVKKKEWKQLELL